MGQSRGAQSGEADRHSVWLEANGLEPKMSPFDPMAILDEIQRLVPGYTISRMNLLAGNDEHTTLSASGPGASHDPALIVPANNDLFSSGTLGRYSRTLNSVMENHHPEPAEVRANEPAVIFETEFCPGRIRNERLLNIVPFIIVSVIKIALALFVLLTAVAYTVWLERKVVGHIQNRWGPTRVGPFGLLQPAADGVKFIFKEDMTPPHVYRPLYIAAPMIAVVFALSSIALIPVGNEYDRRLPHPAANLGCEYWIAHGPRNHITGRIWGRAFGLVFQQQVFPARRIACQRANGQLRNRPGTFPRRRADSCGQP